MTNKSREISSSAAARALKEGLLTKLSRGNFVERGRARVLRDCRKNRRCRSAFCPVCEYERAKPNIDQPAMLPAGAARRTVLVEIKKILVGKERRAINPRKVDAIAKSIREIGLRTPLSVYHKKKEVILVAGRHRLEAMKSVGRTHVECFVLPDSKGDRQLWAISENLHRANLTKLERAEQLAKWADLIETRNAGAKTKSPGGVQPKDKGLSRISREMDITRESLRRGKTIAGISAEGKKAAKESGLAHNEAALLKIAKQKSVRDQVEKVNEILKDGGKRKCDVEKGHVTFSTLSTEWARAQQLNRAYRKAKPELQHRFVREVLKFPAEPQSGSW
jgi:ParB-like chromosome segregation protein Spo0J